MMIINAFIITIFSIVAHEYAHIRTLEKHGYNADVSYSWKVISINIPDNIPDKIKYNVLKNGVDTGFLVSLTSILVVPLLSPFVIFMVFLGSRHDLKIMRYYRKHKVGTYENKERIR